MQQEFVLKFKKKERQRLWVIVLLAVLLVVACLYFIGLGVVKIPPAEIVRIICTSLSAGSATSEVMDDVHQAVLMDIRLPRIIVAVLVGAGLGAAGAVFQGLLMNPLADPYTLGVSTGAAFGATLAIFFGLYLPGDLASLSISLLALAGALLALAVVYGLALADGVLAVTNLILSGVIVSAILSAAISFIKSLAGENVGSIVFWLMGSFASRSWHHVYLCLPAVLVGIAVCCYFADDLNVLSLGTKQARQLGVNDGQVTTILLVASSMMTAVCVSVSGVIGFVGLIVPHLMRMLVGSDHRILLPASALAGALLLCGADTIARNLLTTEIPVGVLTALLGGPFFCYIFKLKAKKQIY
jgi:iron complex transport system permease protein